MTAASSPLLATRGLGKSFGGLRALSDVSLHLSKGEILGIIGPNGAGKSVLINLLTGFYAPSEGAIALAGEDLTRSSRLKVARRGMARTFQNIRLFKRMTVLENVLAAEPATSHAPFRSLFRSPRARRADADSAMELIESMRLAPMVDQVAGTLPYGAARRLEIARALATRPRLLLLDEPAAGMNEEETAALVVDIEHARSRVEGILLVEHDMPLVRALSSRLVALVAGRQIAEGSVDSVLSHPEVIEAYLGSGDDDEDGA